MKKAMYRKRQKFLDMGRKVIWINFCNLRSGEFCIMMKDILTKVNNNQIAINR